MIFDPLYLLFLAPAMLLSLWAQWKVKAAYAQGREQPVGSRLTGAEAAARVLKAYGVQGVGIEPTRGFLGDHYDPRHKVLRLSPDVYQGKSLAAVGIAAHEAGHAIQHSGGYAPLAWRNRIVPMASVGGALSVALLIGGVVLNWAGLIWAAIVVYSAVVLFQLLNLPVEYDASSRARALLVRTGIVTTAEEGTVRRVLSAAALTYVAATITAILTLLYFLLRAGLAGGNND
jgi:Zn-dependent membrane protease YugP